MKYANFIVKSQFNGNYFSYSKWTKLHKQIKIDYFCLRNAL